MELLIGLLCIATLLFARYLMVLGISTTLTDPWAMPGMGSPVESTEREILAGQINSWFLKGVILDSTTVDSRSTVTTDLQRGLVLGRITSSGKWVHHSHTATDGSNVARAILYQSMSMLDSSGTAADKQARIVIFAIDVKASQCSTLDALIRRQLAGRIFFDDDFWNDSDTYLPRVVAKTADYTVTAADNNTIFTTKGAAGAVNFTLPTLARGLRYTFYAEAAQNLTVTSATADTMVTFNDLAADSVSLQTSGEIIGGCIEVIANSDASKWLVKLHTEETQTVTIAT